MANNGTKLSPLVIFKCQAMRYVERNVHGILSDSVFGCCQAKAWINLRDIKMWIEKVWKSDIKFAPEYLISLDNYVCNKQLATVCKLREMGTGTRFIPAGYTYVLQPCDVGIIKPMKRWIERPYIDFKAEQYSNISCKCTVPVLGITDVIDWLYNAWKEASSESIRK